MDITGARGSFKGAEAVLKLRAVRCNGDLPIPYPHELWEVRGREPLRCALGVS